MASPAVLDFDRLLAPISGAQATGQDLRMDASPGSLYYAIKDARNRARALERQMVTAEDRTAVPPPDWKPVIEKGVQALAEKTKDLEIVAYMAEALVRRAGFAGLRDAFRLARELVEQHWDGLYPAPDEDGIATRVAPLVGLNGEESEGTLLAPIQQVPRVTPPAPGFAPLNQTPRGLTDTAEYARTYEALFGRVSSRLGPTNPRWSTFSGELKPETIAAAIEQANAGLPFTFADMLRRAVENDAHLAGCVLQAFSAIVAKPDSIDPIPSLARDPVGISVAHWLRAVREQVADFDSARFALLWAEGQGY
jgi:hypothetical protein